MKNTSGNSTLNTTTNNNILIIIVSSDSFEQHDNLWNILRYLSICTVWSRVPSYNIFMSWAEWISEFLPLHHDKVQGCTCFVLSMEVVTAAVKSLNYNLHANRFTQHECFLLYTSFYLAFCRHLFMACLLLVNVLQYVRWLFPTYAIIFFSKSEVVTRKNNYLKIRTERCI